MFKNKGLLVVVLLVTSLLYFSCATEIDQTADSPLFDPRYPDDAVLTNTTEFDVSQQANLITAGFYYDYGDWSALLTIMDRNECPETYAAISNYQSDRTFTDVVFPITGILSGVAAGALGIISTQVPADQNSGNLIKPALEITSLGLGIGTTLLFGVSELVRGTSYKPPRPAVLSCISDSNNLVAQPN